MTPWFRPSWLTFLGHMKDSLCTMDLVPLRVGNLAAPWGLVVMDQLSVECSTALFEVNAGCQST
jgi:hypothetical protein